MLASKQVGQQGVRAQQRSQQTLKTQKSVTGRKTNCCPSPCSSLMPKTVSPVAAIATATLPSGAPAPPISLIATDVDGTLLNSKQELSPGVIEAVKAAAAVGVPLVVATGKARGPWVNEVFSQLNLSTPGCFLQGLYVCDAAGTVLSQQELEHSVILECLDIADSKGLTAIVYCADRILSASLNEYTDSLKFYKEPDVEAVGHLSKSVGKVAMQKLIFMGPQQEIDALRPVVEERLQGRASTTTAVPCMLEVLPLGASKGTGVLWLLKHMNVDPSTVMALGDGENDVEMLEAVGLGIAMGNAGKKARAVSADVMSTNDEDGVAQAIDKYVLSPRGKSLSNQAVNATTSS
uniref:Uncharacterized protein n=1 Tax=Dunaliella tertiolecta TaxID=3047 RepID=A0A7S3VSK7_DUNTE|mmetsp:Transcript_8945/g.24144  ORF Transcript_8945/g.24144 Transcript_8945/m.24144 type:complete len:349 (+) Transcript_8945:46-1092(+)